MSFRPWIQIRFYYNKGKTHISLLFASLMHKVFCQFYLEDSSLKSMDVIINIRYLMSALFQGLYTSWSRRNLFLTLEFLRGDYTICICFSVQPYPHPPLVRTLVFRLCRSLGQRNQSQSKLQSSGSILIKSIPLTEDGQKWLIVIQIQILWVSSCSHSCKNNFTCWKPEGMWLAYAVESWTRVSIILESRWGFISN